MRFRPRRRVLLIGNISQEPYCNNLLPIAAAFDRAGEVYRLEPWKIPGFVSTWGAKPAPLRPQDLASVADGFAPEIVVCLAGGLHLAEDARSTLPSGFVTVGLALSDPLGLDASLAIASEFDLFYSQDPHALPCYHELGIGAKLIAPAVDPGIFRPTTGEPAVDVLFVGKWTVYRDRLVTALAKVCSVRVYTRSGEDRWSVPVHPPLNRPADLARAYSETRLALETALVEQPGNPLHGSYRITNRPQFAAACGVPSLIEPFDELPLFFEPGPEIATYADTEHLVDQACALLSDEFTCRKIGRSARRRVVRDHTWNQRIDQILDDAERLPRG